ncbi:MAG: hypothetical protein ACXAEL_01145 [Candidatus Hodarchaeales archaeon]
MKMIEPPSRISSLPIPRFNWEMGLMGVIYITLQALLFRLPFDPFIDYYNHICWGKQFEQGLYPYGDYACNEYPVLSVWGWIATYKLSPVRNYYWLSVTMNLPYWILGAIGAVCFYRLLYKYGIDDKKAFGLGILFLFLPLNMVDTLNNHGSLGTTATVILAIYLWHEKRYLFSAGFVAAGFSIKLYPIYVAPFLLWSLPTYKQRFKYFIYLILWLFLLHLPIIFIIPAYFDTLFWRTTNWGGISYGVVIGVTGRFFGFEQLTTIVWLGGLAVCTLFLIFEESLNHFEKFAVLVMTNNLLEYQGGIGHITTVLPFMAIYFLVETKNPREKLGFWLYLGIACLWSFDRFMFKIRKISDVMGVTTMAFMILITTILFLSYLHGLWQLEKIQWQLPKQLRYYWALYRGKQQFQ